VKLKINGHVHAMKAYWRIRGTAPPILTCGTTWRWLVNFITWHLYPQYPFDRRLSGPQSQFGCFAARSQYLQHPAHSLDTIPTELSGLVCLPLKIQLRLYV